MCFVFGPSSLLPLICDVTGQRWVLVQVVAVTVSISVSNQFNKTVPAKCHCSCHKLHPQNPGLDWLNYHLSSQTFNGVN